MDYHNTDYSLVNKQFAIENGPVEIVDLPSLKMVLFHTYVSLPDISTNIPVFWLIEPLQSPLNPIKPY